ncbi:hypothetical protein AVEN_152694-1 [Araneus ventricosus]|uniref:Uncharacterized protein n=1 Tax=Araneus ventricosus TaxID=182803 RepID=A0A4Y2QWS8_ARAVE|nr:hypothetical protein AVEN_152694-1 [Araneus ventricosus]
MSRLAISMQRNAVSTQAEIQRTPVLERSDNRINFLLILKNIPLSSYIADQIDAEQYNKCDNRISPSRLSNDGESRSPRCKMLWKSLLALVSLFGSPPSRNDEENALFRATPYGPQSMSEARK